ncbi:hypothetical protein BDN72DRAFT_849414 [Pluteus cervinus]|uniref:Uncharacterized protein n=1 Tax=Pluteus cervinus TaxID=181527 RepID=A0ACD3A7Z3_9AGAR|nr:hypothetical protein BDN72DRAFT_849414 [Pluteus cervinus]
MSSMLHSTSLTSNFSQFGIHDLTLEEAHKKLDAEISQLEERLHSLKTLRNSLAPVSKLPTEMLSKVFFHTQEDSNSLFHDNMDLQARFFVSWVCRHWRNAALGTPSLWSVISKKSRDIPLQIDLSGELLRRSRNHDLVVNLYEPSIDVLNAFLSQLPRIRQLRLRSTSHSSELNTLLSQPAPRLTYLDILQLPSSVDPFLGVHPNLCGLAISCHPSPITTYSPFISPNLTNLHILKPAFTTSMTDLIDILTSLPGLTQVVFDACFHNETLVVPQERLCLPCLQVLSITDLEVDTVFNFLACLNITQAVITVIWPEDEGISHNDLLGISMAVNHYRRTQVPFQFHHLDIRKSGLDFSCDISNTPSHHRYSLQFPKQELVGEYVDTLFSDLSLKQLETFSTNYFTDDLLAIVLGSKKLQRVTLYGIKTLEDFVAELNRKPSLVTASELQICEIDGGAMASQLNRLQGLLTTRRECGLGLSRLVFVKCPDVDPSQFEGVVDDVAVVD